MSRVVPSLVCAGLLLGAGLAQAEGAAPKPAAPKSAAPKSAAPKPAGAKHRSSSSMPPPAAPSPSTGAAASASAPSASAPPSAKPQKEGVAQTPSEAAPPSDAASSPLLPPAATAPTLPPAPPTLRVYMRSGTDPLVFSARAKNDDGVPTLCAAPCDAKLLPGEYQLRLNGVVVDGRVLLARPGTLQGKFESREASREGGWLALNVGGILGGVFITVAALGGPSWAYVAGGGSLLSGGVIFVLTYRADRATVSFSPGEPVDVRGLPPPIPAEDNSSGPSNHASLTRGDRPSIGAEPRGLGFRVSF